MIVSFLLVSSYECLCDNVVLRSLSRNNVGLISDVCMCFCSQKKKVLRCEVPNKVLVYFYFFRASFFILLVISLCVSSIFLFCGVFISRYVVAESAENFARGVVVGVLWTVVARVFAFDGVRSFVSAMIPSCFFFRSSCGNDA